MSFHYYVAIPLQLLTYLAYADKQTERQSWSHDDDFIGLTSIVWCLLFLCLYVLLLPFITTAAFSGVINDDDDDDDDDNSLSAATTAHRVVVSREKKAREETEATRD